MSASLKWPSRVTFMRHARSAYNELVATKGGNTAYKLFRASYEVDPTSACTRELADVAAKEIALGVGDYKTPLASGAEVDAILTGRVLREQRRENIPHVIFVSPYLRTRQTLEYLMQGWPELRDSEIVVEDRIREQEHGLYLVYNDRRLFFALHPEQRRLYELEGPYRYRFPQGENIPDVRERSLSFLGTLIREFAGKDVFVVTHHIMILAMYANLGRLSDEEFVRLDEENKPANCSITTYVAQEGVGRRGEGKLLLGSYNVCLFNN